MPFLSYNSNMSDNKEGAIRVPRQVSYRDPLSLGELQLENRLFLAPLAGTTEVCFRSICRDFGAALCFSELCSARGIVYDEELSRNYRYLELGATERPAAIQLFGSDPTDFSTAITRIHQDSRLTDVEIIDLNFGCPVPKVIKQGAGADLCRDLPRAAAIARAAVTACRAYGKICTAKIRLGWDEQSLNAVEMGLRLEEAGVQLLSVHGRTREQYYGGEADWTEIARVKKALSIPVVGNGDLNSPEIARQRWEESGVDALMVGRAAEGAPWLFAAWLATEERPFVLSRELWEQTVLRHLHGLVRRLGAETAVREFRSSLSAYIKGLPGAAARRREIMTLCDLPELEASIREISERLSRA